MGCCGYGPVINKKDSFLLGGLFANLYEIYCRHPNECQVVDCIDTWPPVCRNNKCTETSYEDGYFRNKLGEKQKESLENRR